MDLLADYASSDDEEEHDQKPPPPSHRIPPAKPGTSESESAEEKDEDSLSKSAPKRGGIFGSLPPPKSSLFNSLPPPKSSLFNSLPPPKSLSSPNPSPQPEVEHRREIDEEIAGNPKPKSSASSFFSSLPPPKSSSSAAAAAAASSGARKVVQFKLPVIKNEKEDDDDDSEEERNRKASREKIPTSSTASLFSMLPAPRHSATLGVQPSASGMGRRSMLETTAPAPTVSDVDANPDVGYSNNQSNDANNANSTWGLEGETPAYYSESGTTDDDGVDPGSINHWGYDHSTSLGGAYAAYAGALTDASSVSTAGIDASIDPNAGTYEAGDYSYAHGQHVDYSSYGGGGGGYGGHGNNLQYENTWGNSTALPEAAGVVKNALALLGKRGRKDIPPEIVEVNQDELMKNRPREDQVKMTGIAFGPAYQPASTKGKPTKLHKRKHQIGSLFFDMRQKETELAERRSRGYQTKAQTQGKYGW